MKDYLLPISFGSIMLHHQSLICKSGQTICVLLFAHTISISTPNRTINSPATPPQRAWPWAPSITAALGRVRLWGPLHNRWEPTDRWLPLRVPFQINNGYYTSSRREYWRVVVRTTPEVDKLLLCCRGVSSRWVRFVRWCD